MTEETTALWPPSLKVPTHMLLDITSLPTRLQRVEPSSLDIIGLHFLSLSAGGHHDQETPQLADCVGERAWSAPGTHSGGYHLFCHKDKTLLAVVIYDAGYPTWTAVVYSSLCVASSMSLKEGYYHIFINNYVCT